MPCGMCDEWQLNCETEMFVKCHSSRRIAIEWLQYHEWKSKKQIQHMGNNIEKKIGIRRLPVDGYCKTENCVYEFYGI